MLDRIRRRGADESGVVAVLVAIMMVVFLGMAALAVDVGSFYKAQRQAQSAADAGALAGAQELPASTSLAATKATSYAGMNTSGLNNVSVTPTAPFNGSSSQIQVTVTASTPAFFGQIFGLTKANVSATAVAAATNTPSTGPALFADGTSCGNNSEGFGIYFNASGVTMPSGFISNAGIDQSGHNSVFGPSTYVPPCTVNYNGDTTDNTYAGIATPTTAAAATWPNAFAGFPSASQCTYGPPPLTTPSVVPAADISGTTLNLQNMQGAALPPGTYCYGTIDFNSADLSGNVTFQASSFQLNASEPDLTPFYQGLLIYYTGTSQLNVDGTGDSYLTGGIYAPSASVNLNTPNGTINTFVEAQAVIVSGGPVTWNSTLSTSSGPATYALTQ